MKKESLQSAENYSEKVLHYLRTQIINGKMLPREKIVESELASRLGVSRGPVREALKQLTVEGLVDYQPNRGCTVALLSPKDAYEVFFMRGSLEKIALKKSGGIIGDDGLFFMEEAISEMERALARGSVVQAVEADEKFHRQIILVGQMRRLVKMWELLSPLNGAMFLMVKNANSTEQTLGIQHYDEHSGDTIGAHRAMLETFRRGDLEAELQALDTHYIKNGERIYHLSLRTGETLL